MGQGKVGAQERQTPLGPTVLKEQNAPDGEPHNGKHDEEPKRVVRAQTGQGA